MLEIYSAQKIEELIRTDLVGFFFLVFLLLVVVVALVATYILHSVGLYAITKRRRIHHGWLAWIPIGNLWILGSVSDQYRYLVKGEIKNRRSQLTSLSVGLLALYFVWFLCIVASQKVGWPIPGYWVCLVAMVIFPMVKFILQFMAYYDLYQSCDPGNAVLYFILSVVLPVTMPFFVLVCRKKDGGMPPRKQSQAPQEPRVEVAKPEAVEGTDLAQRSEFMEE